MPRFTHMSPGPRPVGQGQAHGLELGIFPPAPTLDLPCPRTETKIIHMRVALTREGCPDDV